MTDNCSSYNNLLDSITDKLCIQHIDGHFNSCKKFYKDYIENDSENKLDSTNLKNIFLQNIVLGYINSNYQKIMDEGNTQMFLNNIIKDEKCSIPTPYCGGENTNNLDIQTCFDDSNPELKIKGIRCNNQQMVGDSDDDNGLNGVGYDTSPYSEGNQDCRILHKVLKKNCFIQNSPNFIQNKEAFKKCIDDYGDDFILKVIHNKENDKTKLEYLNTKIKEVIDENLEDFINLSANTNLLLNGKNNYITTDFEKVDTDNDTVISSEELDNYQNSKTKRLNFFDENKDGEIDATEWKMNTNNFSFVNQSGTKIERDELIEYQKDYEGNRKFQFYDKNNDNYISQDEWKHDDISIYMKTYNYNRIKELLNKKLKEAIESDGNNYEDYVSDDIHYYGLNFKDVILSEDTGSLQHTKDKFIHHYDNLCSITLDTINEDNSILTIDDIKYGKIGTTDGLYGKIGNTDGSYGLIGDEEDNYISINSCISDKRIDDVKKNAFGDILRNVKEHNDDFIKLVNDSDIYLTSNEFHNKLNKLNEYTDRYLDEISYDNFTKLNIYRDNILKSSEIAKSDSYYSDYRNKVNKYPNTTIECKHIDDYNNLNVCRNSEETCTPNLINDTEIPIFDSSLLSKKEDLKQYIFHNQSNIYVNRLTKIDGLTWIKIPSRPNIGLEISEIITNKDNLDALIKALDNASIGNGNANEPENPEEITIDDTAYKNKSILNALDNNTYWEKSSDVYYKLNITHDSCRIPNSYKQQNSEDICGDGLICAYKNQYENSINKISQYTDESTCPMSCKDKLSNLDYCYDNVANIKAENEKTFVDYNICDDDNSHNPIVSDCDPINDCGIGYFREFSTDNDSYTCDITCTECTNKPDNSHYINSNNCEYECDEDFEYNTDNEKCYRRCPEGQRRISDDTCEPCGVDYYKTGENTETNCSECPIGSTTGDNITATSIIDCTARPGYEYKDDEYTLKPGNIDDKPLDDVDGNIDGCNEGFYYNGYECIKCEYNSGISCPGGNTLNDANRILQEGNSWNNSTDEPCRDGYRLGQIILNQLDDQTINCTTCPLGTTNNENSCDLMTGYNWQTDDQGNDIIIQDNLYISPISNDAYYYNESNEAIGCNTGYYNKGNYECVACPTTGINCEGQRIFSEANMTLEPNYSWNEDTAIPCSEGKKRLGYVSIDEQSTIDCDNCTVIPDNSYYIVETGTNNQTYNTDDSCVWSCRDGYDNNNGKCLIKCLPGQKRNSNNTCEPCGEDYYKTGENTDTECTPCGVGGTTNDQQQATSDSFCKAKLGYYKNGTNNYTLLDGYIDNEPTSNPDGIIESCDYNYRWNDEYSECMKCEDINHGEYDNTKFPNDCSNILCESGYQLNENTCRPCGIDRYKSGLNSNECSECLFGSTTGDNITATSIIDCTARPGYEFNSIINEYTLKHGNIDDKPVDDVDGNIDGCNKGFYYNGYECIECDYSEGISCPGGNTLDDANRILQEGYSWNNETVNKCTVDQKREGISVITYQNKDQNINCINCDNKPDNSYYIENDNSCMWSCNDGYDNISGECLIKCPPGQKRISNNTCEPCGVDYYKTGENSETNCSECPIGSTTGDNITATSIIDCTAMPGYEYKDDEYTLKPGNIDDEPTNNVDGNIDRCDNNFYYNGYECIECDYSEGIECTGGPIDKVSQTPKRYLKPGYSWNRTNVIKCENDYIRKETIPITDTDNIECTRCNSNEYTTDNITCNELEPRMIKLSDGTIKRVDDDKISSGNIHSSVSEKIVDQIILEYSDTDIISTYPKIYITIQDGTIKEIANNNVNNKKIYYSVKSLNIKIEDIRVISIDDDQINITKIIVKTNNDGNYYLLSELPLLQNFTNYNLERFNTASKISIYNKQELYENTTEKECPNGRTYVDIEGNVCRYPNDGEILVTGDIYECPDSSEVKNQNLFDNSDCGDAIVGYYTKDNYTYYPCINDEYQNLKGQDTCKPIPEYDDISEQPYTLINSNGVNIGLRLNPGYSYNNELNNITECPFNTYRGEFVNIDNTTNIPCTLCDEDKITVNKASISENDCKNECSIGQYYNDIDCQSCARFGDGIECPGGALQTEAFRYLKPGYEWTGEESRLCQAGYYRVNETTQGPQVYDGTQIPCNECPIGSSMDYTATPDNIITSRGGCLYDVCGDNQYRDDSNECQTITPRTCDSDEIHFLGISENNDNTNYPANFITYDDITAGTYESYDSTCYPIQDNQYFVPNDNYSQFFSSLTV